MAFDQIPTDGRAANRLCACGRPCRPHTFFCGDECRFWSKVQKGPHCWLWTANRAGGRRGRTYGQFTISRDGQRVAINAHVYAYELTHGPVPDGLEVMHSCHTALCVRPDHVSAGTHAKNVQDSAAVGHYHVARPSRQKLTAEECADIVAYVTANGRGAGNAMAKHYNVSKTFVSMLVRGIRRQYDAPVSQPHRKSA